MGSCSVIEIQVDTDARRGGRSELPAILHPVCGFSLRFSVASAHHFRWRNCALAPEMWCCSEGVNIGGLPMRHHAAGRAVMAFRWLIEGSAMSMIRGLSKD